MISFPIQKFIDIFEEFKHLSSDVIKHEAVLLSCIIGEVSESDECALHEWFLLVAHKLKIREMIKKGIKTYIVSSSGQSPISVSLVVPPSDETYRYWLSVTSYGLEYLSLLALKAPTPIYIGGSPERDAFRKLYGGW